jgi:hypothetical protein
VIALTDEGVDRAEELAESFGGAIDVIVDAFQNSDVDSDDGDVTDEASESFADQSSQNIIDLTGDDNVIDLTIDDDDVIDLTL